MSIDSRKIEPVIATEITTSEAQGVREAFGSLFRFIFIIFLVDS